MSVTVKYLCGAGQEHVENVVVSLHGTLLHHAALLEQVCLHIAALDVVLLVTVYLQNMDRSRTNTSQCYNLIEETTLAGDSPILTSMYFPNREELLLRKVLALPKLSSRGLESRIWFSMLGPMRLAVLPQMVEMNCKIFLVASVLPAPDSPTSKKAYSKSSALRICWCGHVT